MESLHQTAVMKKQLNPKDIMVKEPEKENHDTKSNHNDITAKAWEGKARYEHQGLWGISEASYGEG